MISDHSGYPLPSYATTIWLDGKGNLCLAMPSGPESKAHTITIPLAKCEIEKTDRETTEGSAIGSQAIFAIITTRSARQI